MTIASLQVLGCDTLSGSSGSTVIRAGGVSFIDAQENWTNELVINPDAGGCSGPAINVVMPSNYQDNAFYLDGYYGYIGVGGESCPLGFWTIGVGHRMSPDEIRTTARIDDNTIDLLFAQDFNEAERTVIRLVPNLTDLKPARQAALIEAAFVLGGGPRGLPKFKNTLAAIGRKEWRRAAWELLDSEWFREGIEKRLWGIVARVYRLAMQLRTGAFR